MPDDALCLKIWNVIEIYPQLRDSAQSDSFESIWNVIIFQFADGKLQSEG